MDAGLIIHESRFTYADHGLVQVADLGAWWEGETGMPLPLGAVAIRRDLPEDRARDLSAVLREAGESCSRHRVRRLMRAEGLRAQVGYGRKPRHQGGPVGVVANVRQPVVITKRLRNVPATGVWNWEPGAFFGIHHMDAFWFDEAAAPKTAAAERR